MEVGLAAGAGEKLRLDGERMQEVIHPLRRLIRVETLAQDRILRRHADRAATRMAVVAIARIDAHLFLVVGLGDVLVAVQGHHHRMAERDGVRAERDGLRHVGAVADAAGVDQRNLAPLAEVVDRLARLTDRRHARNARVLGRKMRAGAGAAFHTVDIDRVRIAFHRHPHVVIDAGGAELELDRDLPVGRLADLLDL